MGRIVLLVDVNADLTNLKQQEIQQLLLQHLTKGDHDWRLQALSHAQPAANAVVGLTYQSVPVRFAQLDFENVTVCILSIADSLFQMLCPSEQAKLLSPRSDL